MAPLALDRRPTVKRQRQTPSSPLIGSLFVPKYNLGTRSPGNAELQRVIPTRADAEGPRIRSLFCSKCDPTVGGRSLAVCAARDDTLSVLMCY